MTSDKQKRSINESILETLKRSPLSQLSLSSRELFHSNLLAWLCDNHQAFAGALFDEFLPTKPAGGIDTVEREKQNIDLWIHFKDGQDLIVENKVKSLPDSAQLDAYSAKVGSDSSSFLLLCLSRPHFLGATETTYQDSEGRPWNILTYRELSARMDKALRNGTGAPEVGSYHRSVIEDYIAYTRALADLYDHFDVSTDSNGGFFEGTDRIGKLVDGRLGSGIVKMRYSQLACMLCEELRSLGWSIVTSPTDYWKSTENTALVCASMTRGMGLLDFKYAVVADDGCGNMPPFTLGVQIQGNSFRLVAERHRGDVRAIAELLSNRSNGSPGWFDFALLKLPCGAKEYPEGKGFNKFGKEFLYRSKRLGAGIKPQAIVHTITAYAEFIRENRDDLREQVLARCSAG